VKNNNRIINIQTEIQENYTHVSYSQWYLFNPIPDTNPTNPNTRYCCEYGTLNSMFANIWSWPRERIAYNLKILVLMTQFYMVIS